MVKVKKRKQTENIKECTYYVKGMHCASCEILIEKRLLKEKGIEAVEASTKKNQVRIEYTDSKPRIKKLNKIFKKDNYFFSDKQFEITTSDPLFQLKNGQLIINQERFHHFLTITGVSLLIIIGFLALNRSGLSALISVNSQSALPAFFIFGILAGFSSCAALIGGIILSMSKQWSEIYSTKNSVLQKLQPHFLFNVGRLISYALFGALLGIIGNTIKISLTFTSLITVAISIIMILLALQMLGLKAFQKFQFSVPKFITRFAADENNFRGRFMPFLMGFFTFLLPCGFTITTQSLALISGNPLQAGSIMFFFALGTLPALLMIGFSSIKFSQKPHFSNQFLKIAGVLVLFFAIYNINSQLNVLGLKSLNDLNFGSKKIIASEDGFPAVVNGKQIIKMEALSFAYEPNKFKVRVGIPVRWEISDKGTSGCTNAIISKGLFSGQIDLTPGTTSIREFTPKNPGKYKFSCWMGMVSGIIEVVDESGPTTGLNDDIKVIDSGASGCDGSDGCGGGCGGGCGNPNCPYAK